MKKTNILKKTIILAAFGFLLSSSSVFAQIDYLNIVKNDLKKKWKNNKEVGKIYESKKDLYIVSKEGYNLIVYKFSYSKVLNGNLMVNGKNSNIVIVDEEGGGAGGNVGSNLCFLISTKSTGIYNVTQIGEISNPPKNDDGCLFYAEFIKDGYLCGKLNVCTKRGESKYDDIWLESIAKCRINNNNKFELVN